MNINVHFIVFLPVKSWITPLPEKDPDEKVLEMKFSQYANAICLTIKWIKRFI